MGEIIVLVLVPLGGALQLRWNSAGPTERGRESVCVWERNIGSERERGREGEGVCGRETEGEGERGREREREREKERVCVCGRET